MKTVKIAEELSFSKLVLGCMRILDSGILGEELLNLVETCIEQGMTTIDHADIYGGYACENFFGEHVLAKRPELRKRLQIVTKADIVLPGYRNNDILYYDTTRDYLISQVERSLKMLRTDYLDLFLLHRPDPLMELDETAQTLEDLIDSGKVRYIGVSNFEPLQIDALQSRMKHKIVANQVQLSVCAPEVLFDGTAVYACHKQITLMAWSPLAGGKIFQDFNKNTRLYEKLKEIAVNHGASIDQVMYAWIYRCPGNVVAINGSFSMERIKSAIKAENLILDRIEWFQILEASRGFSVP